MSTTCGIYLYQKLEKKLLVCHASKASWRTWSIPKGLKDDGEETLPAAVRELKEETGIDVAELNVLSMVQLPDVPYKKQKKTLVSYLLVTDTDLRDFVFNCSTITRSGHPEIDGWRWINLDKAPLYLHESQLANLDKIYQLIA
jgi:8-oxo-dGTP pyrophosphatase MutT (NUDIX family)